MTVTLLALLLLAASPLAASPLLAFARSRALRGCAGAGHVGVALQCLLREAAFLNRTAVLPPRLCARADSHQVGVRLAPVAGQCI